MFPLAFGLAPVGHLDFQLEVEIPANATARVDVPKGAGGECWLDGKPAARAESAGCLFLDSVKAGKHRVFLRR